MERARHLNPPGPVLYCLIRLCLQGKTVICKFYPHYVVVDLGLMVFVKCSFKTPSSSRQVVVNARLQAVSIAHFDILRRCSALRLAILVTRPPTPIGRVNYFIHYS